MASASVHDVAKALRSTLASISALSQQLQLKIAPSLIAVSKVHPASAVQTAYETGHRHFGENYVQELVDKAQILPKDIQWHFIGHLQSNKCKVLAKIPNLYMVQTVDSETLAQKLDAAWKKAGHPNRLKVLVQVNTSGEASKSGCEVSDAPVLARYVTSSCPSLEFAGLMTIGRYDPEPQPDCFQRLLNAKELVLKLAQEEEVKEQKSSSSSSFIKLSDALRPSPFHLSMGMSHDYELAIRMGGTLVRCGTSIFGERQYPEKDAAAGDSKKTDEAAATVAAASPSA